MRTCLAISVVIHTVVMLWLMLAPNARTLEGVSPEPVLVDLVPPQDAPPAVQLEPPKMEIAKAEDAKAEEKSELARPAKSLPKGDPSKPPRQAEQKPTPKNEPKNEIKSERPTVPQDDA